MTSRSGTGARLDAEAVSGSARPGGVRPPVKAATAPGKPSAVPGKAATTPAGPPAVPGKAATTSAGPPAVSAGSSAVPATPSAAADDTVGRLYVALARLTKRLRRDAPAAISHGSVAALATVVHEGAIRVGDLATLEGVRAPTMTRIVDGLVAEGYAERVPDPADGRACLVRATATGAAMIAGTRSARADLLAARFDRLTEPQRAALAAALPALEALCTDEPVPATGRT